MKSLNPRQKIVYDLLCKMAANGALKITNVKLASELFTKYGFSARDNKPISGAAAGAYLKMFEERGLIRMEYSRNTIDRIIYIL